MRNTLVLICVLGATCAGLAQDKNFDLSKYKFPDYKRHELEFNFNSNGNSYKTSIDEPSFTGATGTVREDYLSSNFHSNFSLGYRYENYTRRRIDYLYSTLSGEYEYTKNKNSGNTIKTFRPELVFNIEGFRRYYMTENKFFLEVSSYLSNHYSESKTKNSSYQDYQLSRNNNLSLNVGLGIGIGRMEKVSDLWQAYYILEKLKEQKSIVKDLTVEDTYAVADQVSKLKNKRFFDSRLRKIAELQALDSLLKKNGLIENSDIKYFTTLNDYWSYGNFQDRESGKVLKILLSPNYSRTFSKQDNIVADVSDETNLNTSLKFNCTKQLNLFWERFFSIGIYDSILLSSTGGNSENFPKNLFQTGGVFGYGFYPDSRTSLKLSGGYSGYEFRTNDPNDLKNWSNNFGLNFAGNYYISPRLQVTGNFYFNYNTNPKNSNFSTYTSYNLGLRYAIF